MKNFSIAELEQLTLIKAHTFRTWEQRFDVFKPQRTSSNIRFYTLNDLSFLLDLTLLNRVGYKVSALAKLSKEIIRQKASHIEPDAFKKQHVVNQLIIYTYSLEIEDFELTLDSAACQWGIDTALEDIILPFLERIELFSYKGHKTSEYHLIVTAVRRKIMLAIEQAKPKIVYGQSALLFLPQGEHYDLFLLYMNYKLRKAGLNVLYLGTDVTAENLKAVSLKKQPKFLVTYRATHSRENLHLQQYLAEANQEALFIVGTSTILHTEELSNEIKYASYRQIDQELIAVA